MTPQTLFLAWQDPASRQWYTVGRLDVDAPAGGDGAATAARFIFAYTGGASAAAEKAGFSPVVSFPDLGRTYASDTMPPLFANRIMPRRRPEFADLLAWLGLDGASADDLAVLARSGGRRATDSFEVYPCPSRSPDGLYRAHFFLRGLRYQPMAAQERALQLAPGERLRLIADLQNPTDPRALAVRTDGAEPGDTYFLGFLPRYLADDLQHVLAAGQDAVRVSAVRANGPPAPEHFRVLCLVEAQWPDGHEPFHGAAYQPLARPALAR